MEIFIDSADISEIKRCAALGVIDGVTTNPSLIAKTGRPLKDVIHAVSEVVDGPISAEVTATETAEMLKQGRELAAIHPNVVVKLPLTLDGLAATRAFTQEGVRTNVTLCFSLSQAVLAAKAGATYVSPFIGRIDDISGDGMQLISQIVEAYARYGYATKVLAASVRHPLHFVESLQLGAHASTLPAKVIDQLAKHPLTDLGLERFMQDAATTPFA